ncbi:MAG: hypothetical protein HZA91_20790 [Verrucomicrobia bacterium]|nr:hypothetical protein [Verrucomicrobiota bacterium]
MKTIMITGFVGMAAGLLVMVGPGDVMHHQLHKWNIRPYFKRCCCANADHSKCAWNDHFGKSWSAHHPGISLAGFLVAAFSASTAGLAWGLLRRAS